MTYSINFNYFEKIDSASKAYWLGFLYADGYISTKAPWTVIVQIKDIDHLYSFKEDLEFNGPVKIIENAGGFENSSSMGRLVLSKKKLCTDLANLNLVSPKINIPKYPEEFTSSFIRGVFDGDGCISITQKSDTVKNKQYGPYLKGTLNLIIHKDHQIFFQELLKSLELPTSIRNSKTEYMKYLVNGSNKAIVNFGKHLYSQPGPYLKRKKEKFLQLQNYSPFNK